MNEIQLFSLRRTIILSLILGLFTMVVVGQALDTGNPDDGSLGDTKSSTSTSTSEVPSTTSTAPQTGTQTETVTQSTYAPEMTVQDQEINDARADFDSASISGIGDSFSNIFNFSLRFLFTSSLFFAVLAIFYIFIFNNNELRNYINQSLKQAGFQGKISLFGKRWVIKGQDRKFSMNIIGFRNLRMKIELPKDVDTDPREFGLRRLENSAVTFCDLEVLSMRLQVVKMYLTKIG